MLILDSGAFSAWTKKVVIQLDDYIAFIKANIDQIDYYVNMDVIPGEFGRKPSEDEVEKSAQASWDNLIYMESEGLHPVPVYHMGESIEWLDKLIDHGCSYIGISPANDRTTKQKIKWLDMVFHHICDSNGVPKIRTHGFGVTSLPILYRYPWYSVDSMSWVRFAAYGSIVVPKEVNGIYRYDISPHVVTFSNLSPKVKVQGTHYSNFGELSRKYIDKYINDRGFKAEDLVEDHYGRLQMCILFFKEVSKFNEGKVFVPKKERSLLE
jgi:hypothetical protein